MQATAPDLIDHAPATCERCGDFGALASYGSTPLCTGCRSRLPVHPSDRDLRTVLRETLRVSRTMWRDAWLLGAGSLLGSALSWLMVSGFALHLPSVAGQYVAGACRELSIAVLALRADAIIRGGSMKLPIALRRVVVRAPLLLMFCLLSSIPSAPDAALNGDDSRSSSAVLFESLLAVATWFTPYMLVVERATLPRALAGSLTLTKRCFFLVLGASIVLGVPGLIVGFVGQLVPFGDTSLDVAIARGAPALFWIARSLRVFIDGVQQMLFWPHVVLVVVLLFKRRNVEHS